MTFGIIGTNFISDWFVSALPYADARPTAVYSRKRETGDAFAKKHGIPLVFDSLDEFLASDAFEAVYVASPNFLHEEHTVRALKAGKHVLCEKPAAPSLAGYLRMCEVAREAGRTLMEAMRTVHDSLWARVKESLPEIGKIRSSHLEFCQYSSRYDRHLRGEYTNTFDPALSNAAILDIGIYPIEAAIYLFGAPKAVSGHAVLLENGFEGSGNALFAYDTHTVAISYSKVADSALPSAILGEKGSITVDKTVMPTRAVLRLRTGEETVFERDPSDSPNNMHEETRDFIRAVRAGELLPAYDITHAALSACDTLRRLSGVTFPSDGE